MAHSLEIRVPLVDVKLFSLLAPLLVSDNGPTKKDLPAVLAEPLPTHVTARAKTGFVTPLREWASVVTGEASGERGLRSWAKCVIADQTRNAGNGSQVRARDHRIPSRAVPRAGLPRVADAVRDSGHGDLRV